MSKILIVEDNEMNLDMLSRRLARRGFEIIVATDGAEAINITKEQHPDLILMDMSLPVMDGWQATRLIKADDNLKHIPIIALTAHAVAGDREKCIAAGCDEYESKPVKLNNLLQKISLFLDVYE
ncbi:MAG: two-component system response regulator [Phototrophicales bacterium]|nr:MAG: two-component system response regulator [Phototrophicales bacterium]